MIDDQVNQFVPEIFTTNGMEIFRQDILGHMHPCLHHG